MELYLARSKHGLSPDDAIASECLQKYKIGDLIKCKISKPHNAAFHRKLFALYNVGFKYWVPGELDCKYGTPEKNFNQFRGDVTILAGYYEVYTRLDGSTRIVPKSLEYGKMEDEEKEKLYSAVIDVLLSRIFVGYSSEQVVKMATDEILRFA